MSDSATAPALAVTTSAKSDYDICWKNVIKLNLEARQQVHVRKSVSSTSSIIWVGVSASQNRCVTR